MPAATFAPTAAWPAPSPHAASPTGRVTISAAPTLGDHSARNVVAAPTTSGKSPGPLLDTGRPLPSSETCTSAGSADRVSHGGGGSWRTPVSACSERVSLSLAAPAVTPALAPDCALAAAEPRMHSRMRISVVRPMSQIESPSCVGVPTLIPALGEHPPVRYLRASPVVLTD